jgi:hypothetical protein
LQLPREAEQELPGQFNEPPTTFYLFTLSKYFFDPSGSGLIVGESGFQFVGQTVNRTWKGYYNYEKSSAKIL